MTSAVSRRKGKGRKSTSNNARHLLWSVTSQSPPNLNLMRPQDNVIHTFQQTSPSAGFLTSSTSTPVAESIGFQLTSVPNYGSFITLFDQYRIKSIEVWLTPVLPSAGFPSGNFYSAVDYDNSLTQTVASISQYSNVVTAPFNQGHYHKWQPHIAVGAYGGSTFNAYKNEVADWIDTAYTGVPHFGLVAVADVTSTAVLVEYYVRYVVEFRNVI